MGEDYYIYDSDGGFSVAIPYVAGLAALAWQIDSELIFEEIVDYLQETKTKFSDRSVVNPIEFIELIQDE